MAQIDLEIGVGGAHIKCVLVMHICTCTSLDFTDCKIYPILQDIVQSWMVDHC